MAQPPVLTRALAKARNGRALAQAIGWSEVQVSRWKHGKEAIPADAIAAMAVYVDDDPIKVLAEERGGTWRRVAEAMKERISAGFEALRLYAKPRQLRLAR